mmetsp:Transcript_17545/g.50082  ORF Transcript_17545/g.50082 Transcript_17545/m.50082 type:complete len:213 (+) Transcript_17545:834-1472(+)
MQLLQRCKDRRIERAEPRTTTRVVTRSSTSNELEGLGPLDQRLELFPIFALVLRMGGILPFLFLRWWWRRFLDLLLLLLRFILAVLAEPLAARQPCQTDAREVEPVVAVPVAAHHLPIITPSTNTTPPVGPLVVDALDQGRGLVVGSCGLLARVRLADRFRTLVRRERARLVVHGVIHAEGLCTPSSGAKAARCRWLIPNVSKAIFTQRILA